MDSLRNIFHEGDTDGSGELDLDELHTLIVKHRVTSSACLERRFKHI